MTNPMDPLIEMQDKIYEAGKLLQEQSLAMTCKLVEIRSEIERLQKVIQTELDKMKEPLFEIKVQPGE